MQEKSVQCADLDFRLNLIMLGPVNNYALVRTFPYSSNFQMLQLTPGGLSTQLREVLQTTVVYQTQSNFLVNIPIIKIMVVTLTIINVYKWSSYERCTSFSQLVEAIKFCRIRCETSCMFFTPYFLS